MPQMLPAENEKPSVHGRVGILGLISTLKTYLRDLCKLAEQDGRREQDASSMGSR